MELNGDKLLHGGGDPEKSGLMAERNFYKQKFHKMEEAFRESEKNVIK